MLLRLFSIFFVLVAAKYRRKPAEYEKGIVGVMVGWGDHATGESGHDQTFQVLDSAVSEIAKQVTSCDDMMVFIVVHTALHRENAKRVLAARGVDLRRIQFIGYASKDTDYSSSWLRDFGPQYVYVNDRATFVQADYDWGGSRLTDSLFPDYLGALLNYPVTHLNFHHSGGNLVYTSDGHAFMSDVLLAENTGLRREVAARDIKEQMGFKDLTIFQSVGQEVDVTGHIDMVLLPVSNSSFIVSRFAPFAPGFLQTEMIARELEGRGFTVFRTPSVNNGRNGLGGVHYTYTNAVILPQKVLLPAYGGALSFHDQEALRVFQIAFPSREIAQVFVADLPVYEGALHCLCTHVFTPNVRGPYVRMLSPSGARFEAGDDVLIEWLLITQHTSESPPANVLVTLELIFDQGPLAIGEGADIRFFRWTVPNVTCAPCFLQVTATTAEGTWSDTSRQPISIQKNILSPVAWSIVPINQLDIFDLPMPIQSSVLARLSKQDEQMQNSWRQHQSQTLYPRTVDTDQ